MSNTAHQSPLGLNVLGALLQLQGLQINIGMTNMAGSSNSKSSYTPGSLVNNTVLKCLTYAINKSHTEGTVDSSTYENLIHIGQYNIEALGNSIPSTFDDTDVPGWGGALYNATNDVTQWGMIRLYALQAYYELNYNLGFENNTYNDFLASFQQAYGFIEYINSVILSAQNSKTYLSGTYSNMDDLITGDLTGVSLATQDFGKDLLNVGRAIDLSSLSTFGLPSNLLVILNRNNVITSSVSIVLIAAGFDPSTVDKVVNNKLVPTKDQEKNLYQAFELIRNTELHEVLVGLNCQTPYLNTLADLLNPQKLFPNSYLSLTVPIYNATQTLGAGYPPSKIYYPIYGQNSITSTVTLPTQINGVVISNSTGQTYTNSPSFGLSSTYVNPINSTTQLSNTNTTNVGKYYSGISSGENIPIPIGTSTTTPILNQTLNTTNNLPQSAINLLLKEAASYYGFDINTVSVISGQRQGPAGLSAAIQMPNGTTIDITDKMAQLARSKGFINSNGQSNLPNNNSNVAAQFATQQTLYLTNQINSKLNGTIPLAPNETPESLIQFAKTNNLPISSVVTSGGITNNITSNPGQNLTGVNHSTFKDIRMPIRIDQTKPKQ
jgi:hypothetical protein